jgi:hypothetical protein
VSRLRRIYRLDVIYPEGSHAPGWRPACWGDPALLATLDKKQRRELAKAEFYWPRERVFLSSSSAYARRNLLEWYGADAEVLASDPVTWPNLDDWEAGDGWEHGSTAFRWAADLEDALEHAREILGEPEMPELADLVRGLPGAVLDEAAKFSAAARQLAAYRTLPAEGAR